MQKETIFVLVVQILMCKIKPFFYFTFSYANCLGEDFKWTFDSSIVQVTMGE